MGFLEIIGSVLTGGATGLVGTILSSVLGMVEASQKRKEKALDYAHEMNLLEMQGNQRGVELENERLIALEASMSAMRTASYEHDASYGQASQGVVNTLRFVRPVLTLLLVGLTAGIYFTTDDLGIRTEVNATVLFCTTAALVWWYGDRRKST
jgi:hypothetical protein